METDLVLALARLNIGAVVAPDIAAVTPVFAKLDIIGVTPLAGLEDKHQLVLGAVERPHAGAALHPDRDVLQLGIDVATGREQFVSVTPVHTNKVDRAIFAVFCKQHTAFRQKAREFLPAELPDTLGELAMADLSFSPNIAVDSKIVRGINGHVLRLLS